MTSDRYGHRGAARKRGAAVRKCAKPKDASPREVADLLTPLEVMLATMRWAHEAAETASAQAARLKGEDAINAAKILAGLRVLARDTAKSAALYVHARPAASKRAQESGLTHEEALAALDAAIPDDDAHLPSGGAGAETQRP
jgi:hypothetical protein